VAVLDIKNLGATPREVVWLYVHVKSIGADTGILSNGPVGSRGKAPVEGLGGKDPKSLGKM